MGRSRMVSACIGAAIRLAHRAMVGIIACIAWTAALAGEAAAPPRAIYVYSYPRFVESGEYERAMTATGVDGAAVVVKWAEIEPHKGVFDFAELDRRIEMARSHGLSIELGLLAGGNAPEWLYEPAPTGVGAQRLNFVFAHHGGKGKTLALSMAPPWDAAYLEAFAALLAKVSEHLVSTGALAHVTVVKLTGINTDTDELRLPDQTPDEGGNAEITDAVQTWIHAGYRPERVVGAMRKVAAAWAVAFPSAWKVLPIIPQKSFPPIGDVGRVRDGPQAAGAVRRLLEDLSRTAEADNHGRFILQMDWLNAGQPVRPHVMELAHKLRVPVAWQTNFYLGREGRGAGCGGEFGATSHCDEASFLRLLESGITPAGGSGASARGLFIEVFPPDVIEYGAAILKAHEEMLR